MLLTYKELAKELSVSRTTVWRLLRHGRLPKPVLLGKLTRWRKSDIEEWVKNGCPISDQELYDSRRAVNTYKDA